MKETKKIVIFSAFLVILFALGAFLVAASGDEGYTVQWVLNGETTSEAVESLPSYSASELVPFGGKSYKVASFVTNGNTATVTLNPTAYYYSITKADGTEKLYDSYTVDAFYTNFQGAESGSTVKLLSDVTVDKTYEAGVNGKTIYFDLNGFDYVKTYTTTQTNGLSCFSATNGAQFYVYSSRPGARIFNAQYQHKQNDGTVTDRTVAFAVFTTNGVDTRVFVGDFGEKGSAEYCDGDNLAVYGTVIAEVYATDTNPNDDVANFNIAGGAYYTVNTNHTMFLLRADNQTHNQNSPTATMNIEGAKLWSATSVFAFYHNTGSDATKSFNVTVSDSVLYAESKMVNAYIGGKCKIDLYDSYILSDLGSVGKSGVTLNDGCRSVGSEVLASGCVEAKILETYSVSFAKNTFSFTLNEDKSSATIDPSSFETPAVESLYRFDRVVAKEENTSQITWKTDDETVTERWYNGVVPTSPISVPDETDIYKFSFGNVTAANGDKTYTLTQVAAFDIKLNLSLYDNFLYNVYIPASVKDSIGSVSVTRDGADNVNIAVSEPELVLIYGAPYYKYTFGIYPKLGADTYRFDMTISGYGGKEFTQELLLSIPAYAFAIKEGNYNDSAKILVEKTLLYINAVYTYCDETDSTGALAKLFDRYNIDPTAVAAVSGADMGSAPEAVTDVIAGASAYMGDTFKFRFTLKSGVSDEALTTASATVSYYENRMLVKKNIKGLLTGATDSEGRRYFDIALRAADMQKDITLTVSEKSVTYNLAKYVKGISNNAKDTELAKNIWWYSEAAKNFVNQKPAIDIEGTPLTDYTIVATTAKEQAAAEILASAIETKLGEKPTIVASAESATGKTITIAKLSPDSLQDFRVSCAGGELRIECAYDSLFESAMKSFVNDYIAPVESSYSFKNGFKQEYFANKVYYSDFGAKGDGATNDFFAMKSAHDNANIKGYTVCADKGATYYIGTCIAEGATKPDSIQIKTNTVWTGAKIIIDDTNITKDQSEGAPAKQDYNNDVFTVASDYSTAWIPSDVIEKINAAGGISRTDKKLDLGLGYPAMLVIYNKDHKQFIRFGVNKNDGAIQYELVLVDENGNIDPSTPLLFDFEKVSSISVYRADVTPITIEGGDVETRASQVNLAKAADNYVSINRGIGINRANTTISNVKHTVTGEQAKGAKTVNAKIVATNANDITSYYYSTSSLKTSGFINKEYYYETQADKVRIYTDSDGKSNPVVKTNSLGVSYSEDKDNTYTFETDVTTVYTFISHSYSGFVNVVYANNINIVGCEFVGRTYYVQGTYDITATISNAVTFKNCTQSNFLDADGRPYSMSVNWGIMGSNYCKNLVYDGCTLSRYDAHSALVNGKIIDSIVQHVSLTGGGDMTIENSLLIARSGTGYGNSGVVLNMREDYGSTWDGTITMKDVSYITDYSKATESNAQALSTANVTVSTWANHYFGYVTHMPNLVVDNLKFSGDMSARSGFAFSEASPAYSTYLALKDIDCSSTVTTVNLYSLNQNADDKNIYVDGVDYSAAKVTITSVSEAMNNNNFNESYAAGENKNYNPYTPPEYYVIKNKLNGVTYNLYTGSVSESFFSSTSEGYPKNPFDTPFVDYVP